MIEVEDCIRQLMSREKPFLKQLPREAGRRESRYVELFSAASSQLETAQPESASHTVAHVAVSLDAEPLELTKRVTELERQVAELTQKLDELIASLS